VLLFLINELKPCFDKVIASVTLRFVITGVDWVTQRVCCTIRCFLRETRSHNSINSEQYEKSKLLTTRKDTPSGSDTLCDYFVFFDNLIKKIKSSSNYTNFYIEIYNY